MLCYPLKRAGLRPAALGSQNAIQFEFHYFLGFINFASKREWSTIKRIIGESAHIEPSKGNDQQNKEYCSKEGDFWEFGVPSQQGSRTDLEGVVSTIRDAKRIRDVVDRHPTEFIKYSRGITQLFGYLSKREVREWKTETFVYVGEPGTGKSRTAAEITKTRGYQVYYKTRGDWWDNYTGQEAVIIDDFYGWLKFDEVLRITDRYPLQVPIKGGFSEFLAKLVIFTSNKRCDEWWRKEWFGDTQRRALFRRLDVYELWELEPEGSCFAGALKRINLLDNEPINDLLDMK